jgi:hypothetical protein
LKATVGGDVVTVTAKDATLSSAISELKYETISETVERVQDLLVKKRGKRLFPGIVEGLKV